MLSVSSLSYYFFFFFNDTATTEIYTLSLHDALPISNRKSLPMTRAAIAAEVHQPLDVHRDLAAQIRSEEHTSELQSQFHLVCRLLLEKKKKKQRYINGPADTSKASSCERHCTDIHIP